MSITMPETIAYGKVVGRFIQAVGDTADVDLLPDVVPIQGNITFTPATPLSKEVSVAPPTTVVRSTITCSLNDLGLLTSPAGDVGVWLVAGIYKVAYSTQGAAISPHDIVVSPLHTSENALDLTLALPPGGPVLVPSEYAELSARIDALAGSGSGGTSVHGDLTGRTAADQHPIGAITGLQTALDGKATTTQGAKADTAVQPADLTAYATDADLSGHASDTTAVHGIADTAALVITTDPRLADARAPLPHTSASVTDFTEAAQDAIAALLAGASGVTLSYDDAANTLTITGPGTAGLDAEAVRDAIGVALVGSGLITVTVNDALDTITISTTATANATDAALRDRTTHTGTQALATITGTGDAAAKNTGTTAGTVAAGDDSRITGALSTSAAPELIRDTMATALVAGANVTITPNDGADTITIAASGGGGGGGGAPDTTCGEDVLVLGYGFAGSQQHESILFLGMVIIPVDLTFTTIACEVTDPVASSTVHLCLCTRSGATLTKVFESSGLDASTGGVKSQTGLSQFLAAGVYWVGSMSANGTPQVRGMSAPDEPWAFPHLGSVSSGTSPFIYVAPEAPPFASTMTIGDVITAAPALVRLGGVTY